MPRPRRARPPPSLHEQAHQDPGTWLGLGLWARVPPRLVEGRCYDGIMSWGRRWIAEHPGAVEQALEAATRRYPEPGFDTFVEELVTAALPEARSELAISFCEREVGPYSG